ncbi:MAG TPA: S1C family serine protease [Longimicrobium sp.]|nr:S1C family serine protease [Longimicrobium sp.]
MKIRLLPTSLVALALALPVTPAAAQPDVVGITRRASPAVITLNTYNAAGRKTGLGSGFFLADGRIATNRHVVEGAARVEAVTQDERVLGTATFAEAVGGPTADLAVLPRITAPPATLQLASGLPEAGEAVVVIGAPEGLSNTVSTGIVSAIRRIGGRTLVQITAPISHGSSGGPVLNSRGQVIGVSVSVLSEGQNLNFAVPVTELSRLVQGPRGRIAFSGDLRFGSRGGRGAPTGRDISDLNTRTLPRITLGQTVSGRLASNDFRRPDGSYADAFVYTGRAGERITVTLRSRDFDAWAVVDDPNGPLREHDDDSGGNLDAELTVTLPHAGQYLIVANSVAEGATGAYTMSLRSGGGSGPVVGDDDDDGGQQQQGSGDEFDVRSATPIRSGQTVTGTLSRSDTRRDDGSYADSYVYNGRAGERLTVTLRARGFQPWVVVDEPNGPMREHIGGRGTQTAQLVVTLPRAGRYIILANSVNAGGTGSYSMTVQAGGSSPVPDRPNNQTGGDISDLNPGSLPTIAPGQVVTGRLTTSDFLRSDGSYADAFVYRGRAGERITVTMRSDDLDAWVVVDEPDGPFRETDDDSGGGTDSRLTVTLPRSGTYLIVANSVGDQKTGRYTLQLTTSR